VSWEALKDHLIQAVAVAGILGGGTVLIDTKVDVARHDERITRIEELDKNMDELREDLRTTREALARVEARQQAE